MWEVPEDDAVGKTNMLEVGDVLSSIDGEGIMGECFDKIMQMVWRTKDVYSSGGKRWCGRRSRGPCWG